MHLLKVLWVQHCKASNRGKAHKKGTLPETQQTQGTDSVARFISTACFHLNLGGAICHIAILPWIVLLTLVSIELVALSARVTSVKSRTVLY